MAPVNQLTPGDIVTLSGFVPCTFITRTTHPLWPHLELVIWRDADGTWHHDALMATQEVGHVHLATPDDRRRALRAALTPGAFAQEPT